MIPDFPSEKTDTDYTDKVLENVNCSEQIESVNVKDEPQNVQKEKSLSVDEILQSGANNVSKTKNGNRILTKLENILFAILVVMPVIQIVCMFAVKLDAYIVWSIVCCVIIALTSFLLGQYPMLGVELVLIAASIYMVQSGYSHGLTEEHFANKSLMDINKFNSTTPEYVSYDNLTETDIVDTFQGKLIYYYRYGCKDCSSIDEKLKLFMESSDYEMVPIETRTDFGKQMIGLYPVDEVPAGIIIMPDGTYRAAMLCKTENGKQDLDVKNLYYLLEFLAELEKE